MTSLRQRKTWRDLRTNGDGKEGRGVRRGKSDASKAPVCLDKKSTDGNEKFLYGEKTMKKGGPLCERGRLGSRLNERVLKEEGERYRLTRRRIGKIVPGGRETGLRKQSGLRKRKEASRPASACQKSWRDRTLVRRGRRRCKHNASETETERQTAVKK